MSRWLPRTASGQLAERLAARLARPDDARRLGLLAGVGLTDPRRLLRQHGLLEPALDVVGRLRLAEEEPLHDPAAEAVQHLHLAQVLDALGDHAQAERSR